MSILAELDTSLQALQALKPPGVTKSRIAAITTLCVENVKSESVLVQKIFTHFKRTPATHKLGVLYVIDSVTRQWIDKAGAAGQELSGNAAPDGTFAAGVHRVTELLPIMMNDLIPSAPYDQKEKISKLVDIWERGGIFPANLLSEFKKKLDARKPDPVEPAFPVDHTNTGESSSAQPMTSSATLQSLSGQSASSLLSGLQGLNNGSLPSASTANFPNSVLNGLANAAATIQPSSNTTQSLQGNPALSSQSNVPAITPTQASALASVIPAHIASNPEALQKHLQLLQQLVQLGVPPEQWMLVIEALQGQQNQAQNENHGQPLQSIPQSVPQRARSRSPPRRRDSPVYEKFDASYRQRSPPRGNTPSMQMDRIPLSEPKWTEFDPSLPEGNIRVLSRTLFVGGTTCGEEELRGIFSQFGQVQTCIPNPEKRHAFIKFCNRAGALSAKEHMANITDPSMLARVRSVRWGVGFGPRDCNDYQTGVSVIPIHRLTEADRKWVLTAPYGGTGGKPIETGTVMEEPDIEIGAGVSSKAISRRLGEGETNRRGKGGGQDNQNHQRHNRRQDRDHQHSHKGNSGGQRQSAAAPGQRYEPAAPPAVPGFGFQLPANSMGMPPYG